MNENSINQLIENFIAYRNLIAPLEETLGAVGKTYGEIRDDLDILIKTLSPETGAKLEKVHAALTAQSKSGESLTRSVETLAQSGEKYSKAVTELTSTFSSLTSKIESLNATEKAAREQIEKIETLIEEKRGSYNLKELQKSLDGYNSNVEKISEFINRDIGDVLKSNAEKIEGIRRENEQLKEVVKKQGEDINALISVFTETSTLLKKCIEGNAVNEQYLFDAFDKWASDRKVKIKKKD